MSVNDFQKLAETKFNSKVAKLNLLERVESQLIFTHNGGLFKATPLLFAELAAYARESERGCILLDEYQNPIKIDPIKFEAQAVASRQFALNAYYNDYESIKKARTGDQL